MAVSSRKAVIFDADGMVVLGEGFRVRRARDLGIPDAVTADFFTGPFQECLIGKADLKSELEKVLPQWNWKGDVEDFLHAWFEPKDAVFDEHIERSVLALRARGVRCYLATNNERYRCSNLLEDRDLRRRFDDVFPSFAVGSKKPEHAFFQYMTNALSLHPSEVVYWDNDEGHVASAKAFGFQAELFTGFDAYARRMRELGL